MVYTIVNTVSDDDEDTRAASRRTNKTNGGVESHQGGASSSSGGPSGSSNGLDPVDVAEGFTPQWREGLESRVERRREAVASNAGSGSSSNQPTRRPPNYGTNRTPGQGHGFDDNQMDEEEERKAK